MKAQCVALLFVIGLAFVTAGVGEMTPPPPFGGILEHLLAPVTVRDLFALGCIRALQVQQLREVFRESNPTPIATKRGQELATLLGRVLSRDRRAPHADLVQLCRPILLGPRQPRQPRQPEVTEEP